MIGDWTDHFTTEAVDMNNGSVVGVFVTLPVSAEPFPATQRQVVVGTTIVEETSVSQRGTRR